MKQNITFLLILLIQISYCFPFNAQENSPALVISKKLFSENEIHQISEEVSLELRKGVIVGVYLQENVANKEEWNRLLGTKYLPGNLNETEITPLLWRKIKLEFEKADGSQTQVELLRPLWWLQKHNITLNKPFFFTTVEIQAVSPSRVLSITPTNADSRKLKAGQQIVIGTFHHQNATVLDLTFQAEHGKANVGSTPNHRIFSKTRNEWIPAEELDLGELVLTQTGTATLLQKTPRLNTFPVYNLEIHQNHNYYVSELKILVHNNENCNPIKYANEEKIKKQMKKRGWTEEQIREAMETEGILAEGKNGSATRYVHPQTGRSVVVDNATKEVFHVGGDGFKYD